MLKSYEAVYDHGRFHWLGTAPDVDKARVIVTVLPPQTHESDSSPKRRLPPEILKESTRILGDIVSSPYGEEEWEGMIERTGRQLGGDREAFN
ncbi:MAG: hypothetical protein G8345_09840 [Magnetococcales bacterium]|nr:hypothetical protein [Magnetococcales bacterium]